MIQFDSSTKTSLSAQQISADENSLGSFFAQLLNPFPDDLAPIPEVA